MNFKKLFSICLLLFPLALNAGIVSGARLGFQQGYLLSRLEATVDISPMTVADVQRAQAGMFLSLRLGKHFAIQPEVNYSQKGGHIRSNYQEMGSSETTWRCEFLEVPLSIRFSPLGDEGVVTPAIFAGPYAAVRLGGIRQAVNGRATDNVPAFLVHSLDAGLMAGAALAVKAGSGRLLCELRYSWGLTDLLDDPWYTSPETKLRMRSLALLFGYSLPLGRQGN